MLKKTIDKLQIRCYYKDELKRGASLKQSLWSQGSNLIKEAVPMGIEPENSAAWKVIQLL